MRRNSIQEISYSRQLYIESWQQVVEVLMGVVNEEAEKETLRIDMLFELIQDLLLKVERERGKGERERGREEGRTIIERERRTYSQCTCHTILPALTLDNCKYFN